MRYYGEEALGLIETTGMVPALEGADKNLEQLSGTVHITDDLTA